MSLFGLGRPKWPYLEPKMLYLGLKSSFRQKGFEPKKLFHVNIITKEERHHKVLTDENIAGGDAAGLQAELERLASLAGASNHDKVRAGKKIEEKKKLRKLSNVLQHLMMKYHLPPLNNSSLCCSRQG